MDNYSQKLKELLGFAQPDDGGMVGGILSQRFQPDLNDTNSAILSTMAGKFTTPQGIADDRQDGYIKQLSSLAAISKLSAADKPLSSAGKLAYDLGQGTITQEQFDSASVGKPLSKEGKVQADLRSGLITPEMAAQASKPKRTAAETNDLLNNKRTVLATPNAKKQIQEALKLNDQAFEAGLFGVESKKQIARKTGFNQDKLVATTKMENIAWRNVLTSLRATFGGMPTEGERMVLARVEGAIDGTAEERKAVLEEALGAIDQREQQSKQMLGIYGEEIPDGIMAPDTGEVNWDDL